MRWGRDRWPEYIPRPKPRRLTEKEKSKILAAMTRAVAASPVLSYLGVRVRALRGRFYVERESSEDEGADVLGRITPLLAATERKLELFPDEKRLIVSAKIVTVGKDYRIEVAAATLQ
jgi:hypothetical protein